MNKNKTIYNSTSFFHRPSDRKALKISAKDHLTQLSLSNKLSLRDKQILLALEEVGILTRHQIERLFFTSSNRARRRLKTLFDNHVLDVGSDQWFAYMKHDVDYIGSSEDEYSKTQDFGLVKSFVYTPSLVGRLVIGKEKGISVKQILYDPDRYDAAYHSHLTAHDLWVSEAYVQMRLAAEARGHDFAWRNEAKSILFDSEDPTDDIVRPDASCSIQYMKDDDWVSRDWYFEMDRGSTKWGKKIRQYWEAVQRGNWHEYDYSFFPVVLCVVPVRQLEKAKEKMIATMKQIWDEIHQSGNSFHQKGELEKLYNDHFDFSVTSWPEFIADPTASWFSVKRESVYSILPETD